VPLEEALRASLSLMNSPAWITLLLATLPTVCGCGARCALRSLAWQPGDLPIGIPGDMPLLVASRPDQHWVVFAQARDDTNGDGTLSFQRCAALLTDRPSLWMVIGQGQGERIDAFLGATDEELAVVREGHVEMIPIGGGARRILAGEPSLSFAGARWERPSDATLLPNGDLLWVRSERHEAELIDTRTDMRRIFAVDGTIQRAVVDASNTWLILDHPSEGAPHRATFIALSSERRIELNSDAYEARPWGIVRRAAATYSMHAPDASQDLGASCVAHYVGIETPIVIGRCETRGPGFGMIRAPQTFGPWRVWRLGESEPVVLDDFAIAAFAEIDRNLLTIPGVLESVLRNGLWQRVHAHSPAEVRVHGFTRMQWSSEAHAWREAPTDPTLPYGVLAWSEDGSALVLRTAQREGGFCFGQNEPLPSQLAFTHIDRH
jgi:hypothetical protein